MSRGSFYFDVMTFFVPVVCIVLWIIIQAIGYKLITRDSKKFISQDDLKKTPVLFFVTYMLFWVVVPVLWRLFVEKIPIESRALGLLSGVRGTQIWLLFIGLSLLIGFLSSQLGSDRCSFPKWNQFMYKAYAFLLVALAEEFLFRFFIAGRLAVSFHPYIGIVVSSFIFLLFHLQTPTKNSNRILYFAFVLLMGIFLGFEYFYFASIWICVLSHFVINLTSNTLPSLVSIGRLRQGDGGKQQ